MLAYKAFHVFSVRTRLFPEARRIGRVTNRKDGFGKYLLPMNIRNRNLGGRNEIMIPSLYLKDILLELRKLARAHEAIALNHEGRQYLGIAMLSRVQIEHKIYEGPLKERARAF